MQKSPLWFWLALGIIALHFLSPATVWSRDRQRDGNSPIPQRQSTEQDSSLLATWVSLGFGFLDFEDRLRFQNHSDHIYRSYLLQALNRSDSLRVGQQRYQKVNFAFPLAGGLQWQFANGHYLGGSAGFINRRESIVLTDRTGATHEQFYALQAVPISLEYRILLSQNFIRLRDRDQFYAAVRWFWLAPGTEIYSSIGELPLRPEIRGNGWGIALGYRIGKLGRIRFLGELNYTVLDAKSRQTWSAVVPDTTSTPANWSLGGIGMQMRATWGWKKIPEHRIMGTKSPAIISTDSIAKDSILPLDNETPTKISPQPTPIEGAKPADEKSRAKAQEKSDSIRQRLQEMQNKKQPSTAESN